MAELEYEDLTDPISLKIIKNCTGMMSPAEIMMKKSGLVTTKRYTMYSEKIRDFEVREDDVWLISFPKCGATWTQEMVWLLMNNFDYESAKVDLSQRFPFMEFKILTGDYMPESPESVSFIQSLPSPRFIKSHLPVEHLPKQLWIKKPKIIYVTRNPKDAAISYFHHFTLLNNYKGPLDEFIDAFLADRVISSPYWLNVLGFWEKRHEANILFNTFEEMKKDLRSVVRRTASFLGVSVNEEQENVLLEHLSFESMKNNKSVNRETRFCNTSVNTKFMRSGKTEQWKHILTPEQIKRFESWSKQWLQGTDCDLFS